jgi:hypothetical protein
MFAIVHTSGLRSRTFRRQITQKGLAMRYAFIALTLFFLSLPPAFAQISIGITFDTYPSFQRVPGYPVYYAPQARTNYFFYDGMYWVYENDNWYSSSWYNGPWWAVDPFEVPLYVLRVPVRYYRHAPTYFRGWASDRPPRWGDHWGQSWEQRRSGWDRWNRSSAPAPAPLPAYQRQYSGSRYPQIEQQAVIQTRNYRYAPRETVARQHFEQRRTMARSAPAPRQPVQQRQPQQQAQHPMQREQKPLPPRASPRATEARQQGKGRDKDDDKDNRGKGRDR